MTVKTESGFTLVELMITLAVAAIILAIATPDFSNLIQNNRITSQTNELVSALHLARSEAVTRSATVTVCTRNSTVEDCDNSADWQDGWIVFVDGGDAGDVDGSDTVLKVYEPTTGGITIASASFTNAHHVQYRSTGRADSAGTLTLCKSGLKGRIVQVSATGRINVTQTSSVCP